MFKRIALIAMLLGGLAAQYGCGYVAAGAAGAAIGAEAADDDED